MSKDIKVEMNFDFSKIDLDLSKELNMAGQIIRKDHSKRLESGRGVNGSSMKALKPSTIKRKGSSQILVDTGSMKNLEIKEATKNKQEVIIKPHTKKKRKGVNDQQIGYYHQTGQGHLPKREWFGISKEAQDKSEELMERRIIQVIDRV
tara:strand:+ start:148 stop:594 length:447 start_codon:yes stop_codon:yes gene_type:complete